MIRIQLSVGDLGRTKFAYSPLAEMGESLYLLSSRPTPLPHDGWLAAVRPRLRRVDMALLTAVVPFRPFIAAFFLRGAADRSTTAEQQLQALASSPAEVLQRELEQVWGPDGFPPVLHGLLDTPAGPRRLADALWEYWQVALEPHWSTMRGVLDGDVAHRASELTRHGLAGLLAEMHPELTVKEDVLRITKRRNPDYHEDHELGGGGMLLVPSIFVWPNLLFAAVPAGPPTLTYPARGIGTMWGTTSTGEDDTLGALIGRSRAAVLMALSIPRSTTELALSLGQSPPAVSQHLAVLRRSALVESWRSGRRVLSRRTALGTSIVDAATTPSTLPERVER